MIASPIAKAGLLALGLISTAILAGCTSGGGGGPAPCPDNCAVSMKDYEFFQKAIKVKVGAKVTWTNTGADDHNIKAVDNTTWGGQNSAEHVAPGLTYTNTFAKAGTFQYYCGLHSSKGADGKWQGMTGEVDVVA